MKKIFLSAVLFAIFIFSLFSQNVLPENSPLLFGNPSGSERQKNAGLFSSPAENFLLKKKQFVLSYNSQKLIPNWVMWHLSCADFGGAPRSNDFRPDLELPAEFYAVTKADYQFTLYGFDRGHVCPSADRTSTQEDNSATFLMTNMIPQTPDLNRIIWKDFESFERSLAEAGNELYIIAGQNGAGGTSSKGIFQSIDLVSKKGEGKKIAVPSHCWKILLVLPEGTDDLSRVTGETVPIAVYMPNVQGVHKVSGGWTHYLCSVDFIEEQTGYDFFNVLPDEIENAIESKIYSPN